MKIEDALKLSSNTDLKSKTLINLHYTSRFFEERFASLLKEFDLSVPQFNVLRILRGQKGKPASLACIQERMVDKNSNTTRLVDKLILKNLVLRKVCPENRRKIEITITEQGMDLLKTLDPVTQKSNADHTSALSTEDLELLNNLLDKLKSHE